MASNNKYLIYSVCATVGIMATLVILVLMIVSPYDGDLILDTPQFITDIFGFILETAALWLAFLLGQVFWDKQKQLEKKREINRSVNLYFRKFQEILIALDQLLGSPTRNGVKFSQEDIVSLQQYTYKIHLWGDSFFVIFNNSEYINPEVINLYLDSIYPTIVDISKIEIIWGNQERLKTDIKFLKEKLDQLTQIIGQ
jgi:hypothetical protein